MTSIASTTAKPYGSTQLNMGQREPVTIQQKDQAVAVILSIQDIKAQVALQLMLLQQAIDEGRASGLSDRLMAEFIADAEQDTAADDPAGHAESVAGVR
jgi:hypothetical protein